MPVVVCLPMRVFSAHASGVHDITIETSSVGVGSRRLSGWARSIGEEPHADD